MISDENLSKAERLKHYERSDQFGLKRAGGWPNNPKDQSASELADLTSCDMPQGPIDQRDFRHPSVRS